MAIIKAINSRASIAHAINYITKAVKTDIRLIGGFNCNPQTAITEMKATKNAWRKTDGRQYKHFIQSFSPDEEITLDEANQIAKELINQSNLFSGYEICYATHKDREHIHTHIIVNSVSFEDGHKFNYSNNQLQQFKNLSDEILEKHNKSICQKNKEITDFDLKKYKPLEKAVKGDYKSWVLDTMLTINCVRKECIDKSEFIQKLNEKGYMVNWQEAKKNITFTDKEGHKIRDKKLSETFKIELNKEVLINEFKRNREFTSEHTGIDDTAQRESECRSSDEGKRYAERKVICISREPGQYSELYLRYDRVKHKRYSKKQQSIERGYKRLSSEKQYASGGQTGEIQGQQSESDCLYVGTNRGFHR